MASSPRMVSALLRLCAVYTPCSRVRDCYASCYQCVELVAARPHGLLSSYTAAKRRRARSAEASPLPVAVRPHFPPNSDRVRSILESLVAADALKSVHADYQQFTYAKKPARGCRTGLVCYLTRCCRSLSLSQYVIAFQRGAGCVDFFDDFAASGRGHFDFSAYGDKIRQPWMACAVNRCGVFAIIAFGAKR